MNVEKHKFIKIGLMIVGIIISAIGINAFLTPANLLSNGLAGIVVILGKLFNINQGIAILVINIPIFIYCRKYVEKEFFISSLINMFIYSFVLGITEDLYKYIQINDIMLQSILGGVITGIGIGLIFKANSSVGGLDIITAVLKIKYDISIKNTYLIINFFIICAGGIMFGFKPAMYTLIAMYLTSVSLEAAKDCFEEKKLIILISNKNEEIAEKIMKDLGRGVTFLDGEGAYTKSKKKLIYCVVSLRQVLKIKEIIYEVDQEAFISINTVDEVQGGGFKYKAL